MKKQLSLSLICFVLPLFLCGIILSSCEKIPGHTVVPSGGANGGSTGSSSGSSSSGGGSSSGGSGGSGGASTMVPGGGSGPIAIGATNTVIFRINNDTTYTWTAQDYNIQIVTVSPPLNLTHPIVSAKSGIGGLNDFQIMYYSLSPGTQKSEVKISLDLLSGNKFLTGTEKVTVTTEAMQNNVLVLKGTFDGYAYVNSYASDSVRVAGSFNLTQQ
ncbi:hypothetical protein [Mucilaginibacter sp. PPCGB 2223]|uniref:hypothetical protein n=1 Tax=Mucilaginibacter sp. PPCGB 2223 TaxID=1886027 RepID=UPI0009F19E9F|nr:hypothetical protein [Mucilaginibacter sp. PPCGB 2223]